MFVAVDSVVPVALCSLAIVSLTLSARLQAGARRAVVDYGVFGLFAFFAVVGIWLFFNRDAAFFETVLRRYWLLGLFGIFILEGAMLLYFAPSESLVPIAVGLTVETDIAPATPAVWMILIGVSVVGATTGQYLLFLLARRWGRERLLEKPWFRVSSETLERFEYWFRRLGIFAVPLSNTLLFTRGMLTIPAGLAEMDDRRFVVLSALGTLSFELILAGLALGVLEFVDVSNLLVLMG